MTYKIITDDTGEEVCRFAIRSALDLAMKNLWENPIKIDEDPILLEDILSHTDAISTTIKSDVMNDVQGMHFRKPSTNTMTDSQNLHFKQMSPIYIYIYIFINLANFYVDMYSRLLCL
jgi:hypothetical protein